MKKLFISNLSVRTVAGLSLFLISLLFCIQLSGQDKMDFVKLSDLDLSKAEQSYGVPVKGAAVTGESFRVAGTEYAGGVGVHSNSFLKFNLMGYATYFSCKVGVNDKSVDYTEPGMVKVPLSDGTMVYYSSVEKGKLFRGIGPADGGMEAGSVVFKVIGDGKELYNSGIIKGGDPVRDVKVSVRGIKAVELVVEDGGDGVSGDHADWIDAAFVFVNAYRVFIPGAVGPDYRGDTADVDESIAAPLRSKIDRLPLAVRSSRPEKDWLIDNSPFRTTVCSTGDGKSIVIGNGLVSRTFSVLPNLATIDMMNVMTGEELLRTPSTEGSLTIDNHTYHIGGLGGQFEYAYSLKKWIDGYGILPDSFQMVDFRVKDLEPRMEWKHKRWALVKEWKPTGKEIVFELQGPGLLKDLKLDIHVAVYDGYPIISKWFDLRNTGSAAYVLNEFLLEDLSMVESESSTYKSMFRAHNIYVESDWDDGKTTFWQPDPRYTSQVNVELKTPCVLQVKLPLGPEEVIEPGVTFNSFRNWMMPYDTEDRERKSLFFKRFCNHIAPWTTENPIFMHCTSTDPEVVKTAIDQCAETGYEMVILSFGSGLNMENESEENIAKYKAFADYAHSKGIEIGGYSLLASRWISEDVDIINPETGRRGGMTFGSSPCLCTEWGHEYFRKIRSFYEKTGFDMLEHDGSYSGDPCASAGHAFHQGLKDSQWKQCRVIGDLYRWMCAKGIFMNVPDDGFRYVGTNKCAVGYREVNWSLPRDRQIILGRQNIYDGMWTRTATNSWTFVPLVQYHGGGAAATLEPLDEHLDAYKAHMIQNYGSGVQACYRGFRLYDTERTKECVKEVIDWYKKYRDILCSDVVHLRRADGKDWDGFMHVNPGLDDRGFIMVFNPTDEPITRTIDVPLYYTGLEKTAKISEQDGKPRTFKLDREYNVKLTVTIPANGYNWYIVRN